MTRDLPIERLIEATLTEDARGRAPDEVLARILEVTAETQPMPRWRAVVAEPPMRRRGRVASGSHVARTAYVVLLIALLVAAAVAALAAATLLLPRPISSAPRTIIVDQQGAGDFRTIAEALQDGRDGDTILVRAGTYAESPLVTREVTIEGDGDGDDVVVLVGTPERSSDGLTVRGSNATLRNLSIRAAGPSVRPLVIDGGAPSLVDLWVDGPGFISSGSPPSVRFTGGTTGRLTDSVVSWTEVDGASAPTLSGGALGGEVVVRTDSSLLLRDIHAPHILVERGADATIERVTLVPLPASPAGLPAIVIDGSAVVADTTVEGDYPVGIEVTDSGEAQIVRNVVTVTGTGATLAGSGATLIGNEFVGGTTGVAVGADATPILRQNRIERNGTGLVVEVRANPELVDNAFCANRLDLSTDDPTLTLTANTECLPRATPRPIDSRGAS